MASSAERPILHPDELIDGYERALIGGHLWSPETSLPPLRAEEFFLERHRVLWETLQDMGAAGERPSLPGLVAQLRQRDRLEAAGGLPAVMVAFEEGTWAVPLLLLGYADRLLALSEEARLAVQDPRPRGVFRLGAMESTASVRLHRQKGAKSWKDFGPTEGQLQKFCKGCRKRTPIKLKEEKHSSN